MKLIFINNVNENSGPDYANNGLLKSLKRLVPVKVFNVPDNRIHRIPSYLKILSQIFFADWVIFHAYTRFNKLLLNIAHLLSKKTILICHGILSFENEINRMNVSQALFDRSDKFLMANDLIFGVSKKQAELLIRLFPEIKGKVKYFYNGYENNKATKKMASQRNIKDKTVKFVLSGGSRPIKRNNLAIKAIYEFSKNRKSHIDIFGDNISGEYEIPDYNNNFTAKIHGQKDKQIFEQYLLNADIFLLISFHESFGLSAIDALKNNTSVILSKSCGVVDVLDVKDYDLVDLSEDEKEIAKKIEYLLKHPNHERLINSAMLKKCTWDSAAERFVKQIY